ncbi:MAG: Clp1/GlmU family protein [Candidatus Nitrosocaldaceae archaeon]
MQIDLKYNQVILVKGPAIVSSLSDAYILGVNIKDKIIRVRENKILPIEGEGSITITLEGNGRYEIREMTGIGTQVWDDIRDAISFKHVKSIIIIGANDTGKSTLAIYLTNMFLNHKIKVFLIDADVGQGDLAPPACIGASWIKEKIVDLTIPVDFYEFIGSLTPAERTTLIIDAINRLYTKRGDTPVIINTDGYIDRYGLEYKIRLIDMINPDMILSLGRDTYSDVLLNKYKGKIYLADKPKYVQKDPRERLSNRLRRYKQFISNCSRSVKLDRVWLFGDVYHAVIKDRYISLEPFGPILDIHTLKDMYVALSINKYVVGFGVIRDINSKVSIQTSYEGEFDTIMFSEIKLNRDLSYEYKIRLV